MKLTFKEYLTEAVSSKEDMLDISIKDLFKMVKTDASAKHFLEEDVTITEKVDGVKLTMIRNSKPFNADDYSKNWIVAYKNMVQYPEDFHGIDDEKSDVRKNSIGSSQFKLVHEHLAKYQEHLGDIPTNTEFFVEFVMKKPTLTRKYDTHHSMFLIGYSKTKYHEDEKSGRVTTTPEGFFTSKRNTYAKELKLSIPHVMYRGKLNEYTPGDLSMEHLREITKKLLSSKSILGGKIEGCVLEFEDGAIYKVLQADQHDKDVRKAVKDQFKDTEENEGMYWKQVRIAAKDAIQDLNKGTFRERTSELSHRVYSEKPDIQHSVKKSLNVQDDIFLTAKTLLMKKMPGNNGALFSGRFSPLTKAHVKIIENALAKYDSVTVNIVKAKVDVDNPFPVEVQEKLLREVFGDSIEVTISSSGLLPTIINKSKHNINHVLAGTDRVDGYAKMMDKYPDIEVTEIPRVDKVSGTQVREALRDEDEAEFKKLTDKKIWPFYNELKRYVR